MQYKRVLLKLSGEALAGEKHTGFDEATVRGVAKEVKKLVDNGFHLGIVIGGGNFWRGRTGDELTRSKADQIGMLATVMNCIYVSDIFRSEGMDTEIFTPFVCGAFSNLYSIDAVNASLDSGKVTFFAGGTGHPYFSTDTATVLRACLLYTSKEIMFMYDMLNDKQKKVTELTKEVQELESVSRGLIETIDQKKMELQNLQVELDERKVPAMTSSEIIESNTPVEPSLEEEFVKNYAPTSEESNGSNANQKILELKKQGYSEVEIAKKLGKGLGEVKLVLGLFQSNM